MSTTTIKRFASPYEDPPPPGAEGWEELYPYYLHFRDDRREMEEARFWFADTQHWPSCSSHSTRSPSSSPAAASASTTPATTSSRRPTGSTTASTTATST